MPSEVSKRLLAIGLGVADEQTIANRLAALLAQIGEEMVEKAAVERFVFVFYPGSSGISRRTCAGPSRSSGSAFSTTRLDLRVLTDGHAYFPVDGHPSPRSCYALAWLLDRDLPD